MAEVCNNSQEQKARISKLAIASLVLSPILLLYVSCRESIKPKPAISVSLRPSKTSAAVDEPIEFKFFVANESDQPTYVPVPDEGTLSFNTLVPDDKAGEYGVDGHTALAANPRRRDYWQKIGPGESLSFSFSYEWQKPGLYEVCCKYYSRFNDKPFNLIRTSTVKIEIRPKEG